MTMGYCHACGRGVSYRDATDGGAAVTADGRVLCVSCADDCGPIRHS